MPLLLTLPTLFTLTLHIRVIFGLGIRNVNILQHSVSHFYLPIPKHAPPNYTRKTVKVKTETGETEIAIGDRVIYNGHQLRNLESFDYSSLKPGDKEEVYHIPRVSGGARTRQTLRQNPRRDMKHHRLLLTVSYMTVSSP